MKKLILVLLMLTSLVTASEEVPTQEEVAKLYVATFNRASEAAGLTYWTNSGDKLTEIAASFFVQPEAKALYPEGTSNASFVASVYQNLFNRDVETAGLNYWEDELNRGVHTRDTFIQVVINGAKDDATSLDKTILSNKTTVGLSFAAAGLDNVNDAKTIMAGVSADAASMTSAVNGFGISLFSTIINGSINANNLTGYTLVTQWQSGVKIKDTKSTTFIFLDNNQAIAVIDYFDGSRRVARGTYHPYDDGDGLAFTYPGATYDNGESYIDGIAGPNNLTEIVVGQSHNIANNILTSIISNNDNGINEATVASSSVGAEGENDTSAPKYSEINGKNIIIYNNISASHFASSGAELSFSHMNRYDHTSELHCTDYGYSSVLTDDISDGIHSKGYYDSNLCIESDYTNAASASEKGSDYIIFWN